MGSGFPIPGFLRTGDGNYSLTDIRNSQRLGTYTRTDLRINQALDGVNPQTGQAYLTVDTMFPILPSAGLVFER